MKQRAPKISGRVPARLTKLREISSSDARVLSLWVWEGIRRQWWNREGERVHTERQDTMCVIDREA